MFGDNFKKYRTEKGLSQNDIAERLFVTRQCVSKWEKGITEPNLETLARIGELLGVSVDALVKDSNRTAEKPRSKNTTLFIANILIAIFFEIAFFIMWRFLPAAIPSYFSHEGITIFESRDTFLLNLLVPVVFLATDIAVFFAVKKTTDKRVIYISHGVIVLFQVAYFVFMLVMYAKYFENVISLITCMSAALLLCVAIAMHPKLNKKNEFLGVRTSATMRSNTVWRKTNALACYLFAGVSLIILIVNMSIIFDYSYLCLLAYLVPAIVVIVYAKLVVQIMSTD